MNRNVLHSAGYRRAQELIDFKCIDTCNVFLERLFFAAKKYQFQEVLRSKLREKSKKEK